MAWNAQVGLSQPNRSRQDGFDRVCSAPISIPSKNTFKKAQKAEELLGINLYPEETLDARLSTILAKLAASKQNPYLHMIQSTMSHWSVQDIAQTLVIYAEELEEITKIEEACLKEEEELKKFDQDENKEGIDDSFEKLQLGDIEFGLSPIIESAYRAYIVFTAALKEKEKLESAQEFNFKHMQSPFEITALLQSVILSERGRSQNCAKILKILKNKKPNLFN